MPYQIIQVEHLFYIPIAMFASEYSLMFDSVTVMRWEGDPNGYVLIDAAINWLRKHRYDEHLFHGIVEKERTAEHTLEKLLQLQLQLETGNIEYKQDHVLPMVKFDGVKYVSIEYIGAPYFMLKDKNIKVYEVSNDLRRFCKLDDAIEWVRAHGNDQNMIRKLYAMREIG